MIFVFVLNYSKVIWSEGTNTCKVVSRVGGALYFIKYGLYLKSCIRSPSEGAF